MQLHIITRTQALNAQTKKWDSISTQTHTLSNLPYTTYKKLDAIVTALLPSLTYTKSNKKQFVATWHVTS
jgi:hypothetical protein